MTRTHRILAITGILATYAAPARAWQAPDVPQPAAAADGDPSGGQVLTQGPIHEAFAQPVLYDPKPSPVVAKAVPAPINELPPDQKPKGDNVQWIPGYWAWDDSRSDFLWVSGVWRAVPAGRQWVPGYWSKVDGGSQWVSGYWAASDATQVHYLPEPPASLEQGPSSPAPDANSTWAPGTWAWQDNQYQWRPGFWVNNQPNWMWSPATTSWTPNGYVTNQGYWDYPMASRGQPFAPVYFGQGITGRPNFAYTPGVGLLTSALATSLFVRPAYNTYLFGDYYGANHYGSGIYPWYAFHNSRYGYDPLYAYSASQNLRTNPRWANEIHDVYQYRREHAEARPPRTFAESRNLVARPTGGNSAIPAAAANLALARPLSQIANPASGASANAIRFEKIDAARQKQLAAQTADFHKMRDERTRREIEGRRDAPAAGANGQAAARPLEMPRSPLAGPNAGTGRVAPPAPPAHPEIDKTARPNPANANPVRHEPRPDTRPPAPHPTAEARPNPAPAPVRPNPAPAPRPNPAPATQPNPGPAARPPAAQTKKK